MRNDTGSLTQDVKVFELVDEERRKVVVDRVYQNSQRFMV